MRPSHRQFISLSIEIGIMVIPSTGRGVRAFCRGQRVIWICCGGLVGVRRVGWRVSLVSVLRVPYAGVGPGWGVGGGVMRDKGLCLMGIRVRGGRGRRGREGERRVMWWSRSLGVRCWLVHFWMSSCLACGV